MKTFFKNFISAIPLAFGAITTLFSVVYALEPDSHNNMVSALFLGLIGIPTLFAAVLNLWKE